MLPLYCIYIVYCFLVAILLPKLTCQPINLPTVDPKNDTTNLRTAASPVINIKPLLSSQGVPND